MIRLEQVTKQYRGRRALDALTLEVSAGEVVGLLGQNGAGKSTAFGVMLGLIRPTRGEAFLRGFPSGKRGRLARRGVGAMFETPAFFGRLTARENLEILAAYSGPVTREEIGEAARLTGIGERLDEPVATFSRGMRQRLGLAQALLPMPELLLLDEPASGLDPEGIRDLRRLISHLNRDRGVTVVLSSHLLAEAELLCGRVAILREGRLLFDGPWERLGAGPARFRIDLERWDRAGEALARAGAKRAGPELVELAPGGDVADLVEALVGAGARVRGIEPVRPTLEELYMEIADGR
jgi:ABC-2 type transport system ATP-binding protein